MTTIELNNEEAELFKWFRKYQHIWEQARQLRPGSLVLHFNNNGDIKKKEFHEYETEDLTNNLKQV